MNCCGHRRKESMRANYCRRRSQALLLSSITSAAFLGGTCPSSSFARNWNDIACQHPLPSDEETISASSPPLLTPIVLSAWPQRATYCVGDSLLVLQQSPSWDHLGHATAPSMVMTTTLFAQLFTGWGVFLEYTMKAFLDASPLACHHALMFLHACDDGPISALEDSHGLFAAFDKILTSAIADVNRDGPLIQSRSWLHSV
ncbi:uncharacterized protein [Dermacentor albipictus]|uniref:uncharacterized protein n=1 Tax=Dermacentor albipictus TaxID=60249 RepID=UPI0031FD7711